jgi:preprotein translocase subunit SecA
MNIKVLEDKEAWF